MATRLSLAALVLLVLAGFAFWPAYLSDVRAVGGSTHAHAALGAAWLLLLAVQPMLLRAGRRAAHRALGRAGVAAGIAFALSGVLIAHQSLLRMGAEQFAREGRYVYLPLAMAAIFAGALALAVRWRSMPAVHGRFMAATALPLLDPVLARLLFFYGPPLPAEFLHQVPAFVLTGLALFAMAGTLPGGSPGRASLGRFGMGVAAVLLGYFVLPDTTAWLSFVAAFRDLPIG